MDDSNMIIIHGTTEQAQTDLDNFHTLCRQWWALQGYDVEPEGVVPKNAATGQDEPAAQKTTCWDTLKPDPTDPSKSYWISPSSDPRFVDWKDHLAAMGHTLQCEEIAMPEEWYPQDEA